MVKALDGARQAHWYGRVTAVSKLSICWYHTLCRVACTLHTGHGKVVACINAKLGHRLIESSRARYSGVQAPGLLFYSGILFEPLTADHDMAATGLAVDRDPYETSGQFWDRYDRGASVREELGTFRIRSTPRPPLALHRCLHGD